MANNKKNSDLGFGTKLGKAGDRLVRRDGSYNIRRSGQDAANAYQMLIKMSSARFIFFALLFFIGVNSFFALMFLLVGVEQLVGVPEGGPVSDFLYAFFFSIQTFTTVGYGGISPMGISANFVASLCATVGLVAFALFTGLLFARFARPRSHIAFSDSALIAPYKRGKSFQCRIVNTRDHKIMHVSAQLTMTWIEERKGILERRYAGLPLEVNKITLFPLNWTLVHKIDSKSPLHDLDMEQLKEMHAEFMLMITGFDESYHQSIHANTSYVCGDIVDNAKFKRMYSTTGEDATELNLEALNTFERLED